LAFEPYEYSVLYLFLSRNIPELIRELRAMSEELEKPIHQDRPEDSYLKSVDGRVRKKKECRG